MKNQTFVSSSLCLLALICGGALASIEREPVKVDRTNAGPKYDIDDLERTRVLTESNPESNQVMTAPVSPMRPVHLMGDRDDSAPMISIRRIFLVPMTPPMGDSSSDSSSDTERQDDPIRGMLGLPPRSLFSPFSSHRLFGGDEASRPVNPDESQERPVMSSSGSSSGSELERPRPNSALFDPIQMLMEAMTQALNPANMMPQQPPATEAGDLNKEASGEQENTKSDSAADKKQSQSFNSTKEDIVEIDGKNPLNETETTETTTTTTTASDPTLTTSEPAKELTSKVEKADGTTISPAASEPASTKEPLSSEIPSSPSASTTTTTTTTEAANKEDTTTAKATEEKLPEFVSKVERLLERMVERKEEEQPGSSTSTDKPSS